MESDQKRALLAVVLSGLVLFGWQSFFAPQLDKKGSEVIDSRSELPPNSQADFVENSVAKTDGSISKSIETSASSVDLIKLKRGGFSLNFLSDLSNFQVEGEKLILTSSDVIGSQKGIFNISLFSQSGAKVNSQLVSIKSKNDHAVSLVFGNDLSKTVSLELLENGTIQFATNFLSKITFDMETEPERLENGQVRTFKIFSDDVEEFDLSDNEVIDSKPQWFGVDFNYHIVAFSFNDRANYSFKIKSQENKSSILVSQLNSSIQNFNIVFAKKNYDDLIRLGKNLDKSVDFGVLGLLAVPILRGLQFFYNVFPNYGVSIIILTILIRLVTFPLQYKSFKSMKKMSVLQPEIAKLKEKFKDDPQRLQKETMELFKRNGANPLGGCLPMLLQMPIFFAFYKVLYAAVELVGQPFYFWINDLSEKDPYFVLPVILTAAMFFQQKLTPTTSTDPTQQKVMMFMPIIFGFIMKDMPSGLVLYICVSTIFQMFQQFFVNKSA